MEKYISILRGINVSGKNKIKMDDLKLIYESVGFKNVATYIQSGNVIFEFKTVDRKELSELISGSIKKKLEFDVPVFVLTSDKLNEIFSNNPFINNRDENISKLHVTVLDNSPDKNLVSELLKTNSGIDEFILKDNIVYLFCPSGYGKTKLTNAFFEKKLKVSATTRNWKTITKLVELSE